MKQLSFVLRFCKVSSSVLAINLHLISIAFLLSVHWVLRGLGGIAVLHLKDKAIVGRRPRRFTNLVIPHSSSYSRTGDAMIATKFLYGS